MYAVERPGLCGVAAGASIPEPEAATLLFVVGKIRSELAVAWACNDGMGYVEEAVRRLDVKEGEVFGFLLSLFDVSSSLKVAAWEALNEG